MLDKNKRPDHLKLVTDGANTFFKNSEQGKRTPDIRVKKVQIKKVHKGQPPKEVSKK